MTEQGYGQWEYRVAVISAETGRLESVDGAPGALCFAAGSPEPISIVQALDVWGLSAGSSPAMAALSPTRAQYVLKRARRQGGFEGARIHMQRREG